MQGSSKMDVKEEQLTADPGDETCLDQSKDSDDGEDFIPSTQFSEPTPSSDIPEQTFDDGQLNSSVPVADQQPSLLERVVNESLDSLDESIQSLQAYNKETQFDVMSIPQSEDLFGTRFQATPKQTRGMIPETPAAVAETPESALENSLLDDTAMILATPRLSRLARQDVSLPFPRSHVELPDTEPVVYETMLIESQEESPVVKKEKDIVNLSETIGDLTIPSILQDPDTEAAMADVLKQGPAERFSPSEVDLNMSDETQVKELPEPEKDLVEKSKPVQVSSLNSNEVPVTEKSDIDDGKKCDEEEDVNLKGRLDEKDLESEANANSKKAGVKVSTRGEEPEAMVVEDETANSKGNDESLQKTEESETVNSNSKGESLQKTEESAPVNSKSIDESLQRTLSPEHFHTAPVTPDTETTVPAQSPTQENFTPQSLDVIRVNYTIQLEVICAVELDKNTHSIMNKEVVKVKELHSSSSLTGPEVLSESTDKSKRQSISSEGSVYSGPGFPFPLKPRVSVASVQTSSTSTNEDPAPPSSLPVPSSLDTPLWKNNSLITTVCDEALNRHVLHSSCSAPPSARRKTPASRFSLASKLLFEKAQMDSSENTSREHSLDVIVESNEPKSDATAEPEVKDVGIQEKLAEPLKKSTPRRTRRAPRGKQKVVEEADPATPIPSTSKMQEEVKETERVDTPKPGTRSSKRTAVKKELPRSRKAVPLADAPEEEEVPKSAEVETKTRTPPRKKGRLVIETTPVAEEKVVATTSSSKKRTRGSASVGKSGTPTESKEIDLEVSSAKKRRNQGLHSSPSSSAKKKPLPSPATPQSSSLRNAINLDNIINEKRRGGTPTSTDLSSGTEMGSRRKKKRSTEVNDVAFEYTPGLEIDETVVSSSLHKGKTGPGRSATKSKTAARSKAAEEAALRNLGPIPETQIFANFSFLLCYVKPKGRRPTKRQLAKDTSASDFSMSESEDVQYYDKQEKIAFDEAHLRRQLVAGGGTVYDRFSDIPIMAYRSTCLVTNRPNRSSKFILSLVHSIQIVLHLHVIEACRGGGDLKRMIIPHIGWSSAYQKWIERPKNIHLTFEGKSVHLFSKSQDPEADALFCSFWTLILQQAGATLVQDLNYADVIVTDSSLPEAIKESLEAIGNIGPALVSTSWVMESLMHGYPLDKTIHSSFSHDYSSANSSA